MLDKIEDRIQYEYIIKKVNELSKRIDRLTDYELHYYLGLLDLLNEYEKNN